MGVIEGIGIFLIGASSGIAIASIIRLEKAKKLLKEMHITETHTLEDLEKTKVQLDTIKHFIYFLL